MSRKFSTPDEYFGAIVENRNDYEQAIAELGKNRNLSREGRTELARKAWREASNRHLELRRGYTESVAEAKQSAVHALFELGSPAFHKAVLEMSRLDAKGRASAFELATRVRDQDTAKAIAAISYFDNGDLSRTAKLVDVFNDPSARRLIEHEQAYGTLVDSSHKFALSVALRTPRRTADAAAADGDLHPDGSVRGGMNAVIRAAAAHGEAGDAAE